MVEQGIKDVRCDESAATCHTTGAVSMRVDQTMNLTIVNLPVKSTLHLFDSLMLRWKCWSQVLGYRYTRQGLR